MSTDEGPMRSPIRPRSESDIAVLWTQADTRCVLSWLGDRFRVRVVRGDRVVHEDIGTDEGTLFNLAQRWRHE